MVASPWTITAPIPSGVAAPVIELRDVCKVYRTGALEVEALRGVSLSIAPGEYVAIMGPSGSGKSTLMHILGCLDVATSGEYRLAGEDVGAMDETDLAEIRNRQIGFVFQQFNLLPSLTALRNVELPLAYGGVSGERRHRRAREALERVGLADRVEHRPGELSGGQQQRVAVARALVGDPALLLADEPTGNLDSKAAVDVLRLFDELHRQGRTVVLITHEAEVAQHAARVIRIRDGAIAADDAGGAPVTWSDLLRNGWDAIRTHKLRSTLTALGILIGIAAVVLTVGLGQGAQQKVSKQLAALGGNLLIVSPGSSTSGGVRGGFGSASTLTMADATALSSKTAAPDVERRGTGVAERQPVAGQRLDELDDDGRRHDAVRGFPCADRTLSSGRFITAADESSAAAVTVLASDTATELFGPFDPVGQSVTINSVPYQVVGVLTSAGSDSTTNLDDQAIVPFGTASQRIVGGTNRTSVQTIYVKAASPHRLVGRLPGDERAPAVPTPGHRVVHLGLLDHDPAVGDQHDVVGRQHADEPADRHRRAVTARRRHRRHEHHAGVGQGAHPRDRAAQGPRRHTRHDPAAVPLRGVDARPDRRAARRGDRSRRRRRAATPHLQPDRHLGAVDPDRHRGGDRHRHRLRGLSGRAGRPALAHRRTAQRMTSRMQRTSA